MTFNLKKIRKELKINQLQLSEMIGFSQSYISTIDSNRVFPSDDFLFKIKEVFNIDVDEYLSYNRINKNVTNVVQEANGNYNSNIKQTVNDHEKDIKELYKHIVDILKRLTNLENK